MNKNLLSIALLLTTSIFFAACGDQSKTQPVTTTANGSTTTAPPASEVGKRDNTLVRVLNAGNTLGTVDVFAGDAKIFESVAFKTTTPFKELPAERRVFKVRVAGMDSSPFVAENSEGLDAGKHYTIIILPGDGNRRADIQVLEDDMKIPAGGDARVRLVHAVRDGSDLDVFATGNNDELFEDVNFQQEEGYDDVKPYAGNLEIRPEGKTNPLFTLQNAKFEANKAYTLIITGRINNGKPEEMDAIIVEDKLGN